MTAHPSSPRRYLALWFPFLPADRLRRISARSGGAPDEPVVLVQAAGGGLRLAAVSREALALGLRPGTSLADARARIPQLCAHPHDPAADAALLGRMAALCDRWSPRVALDPPDGLFLDMTGGSHLFGGEAAVRAEILGCFRRGGVEVRGTLAGTPDAARALARHGRVSVVAPGREAEAVRPLPVAALDPDGRARTALALAGLRQVADLADLPSGPLTARFGAGLAARLRRVLGREDARITPLRPIPACRREERFAEPIFHAAAVAGVLRRLVEGATAELEAQVRGGRAFEARFFRADGAVRRVRVETGRPTRDPAAILGLLNERLDALSDPLDPGYGFDLVRLDVPVTEALAPRQADLEEGDGPRAELDAVSALVDRLVARFGPARVLRFAWIDSHDPVRACRLVPVPRAGAGPAQAPRSAEDLPRPLRLIEPPEPVEAVAEVPDGPPAQFRWRRIRHRVVRAEGPERIAPEWWRAPDALTRDYFRVEDEAGRRFWLFRAGLYGAGAEPPRWYLHGLFA